MWTHAKSIKVIDRADGKAKVNFLARHDGLYEYRAEAEIQGDEYEAVYWSTTDISGLFASAREVEQAAFDDIAWLRQQIRTLRIYDLRDGVLALDFRDLINLLAPRSLEAQWTVSPVALNNLRLGVSQDEFMIVGPSQPGQDQLEQLAASGSSVSGIEILEAANAVSQVIWGQFVAIQPGLKDAWVIIRAIDSTFYEVTSADEDVHNAIWSSYRDVKVAHGPITSVPIHPI